MEALEVQLAARLFDRNRDGYTLTAAGRQMIPGAERVEREMAALERGRPRSGTETAEWT